MPFPSWDAFSLRTKGQPLQTSISENFLPSCEPEASLTEISQLRGTRSSTEPRDTTTRPDADGTSQAGAERTFSPLKFGSDVGWYPDHRATSLVFVASFPTSGMQKSMCAFSIAFSIVGRVVACCAVAMAGTAATRAATTMVRITPL